MRSLPVVVVAGMACIAPVLARAGTPLDKPPFTATPGELLAAAKAAGDGAEILREDSEVTFDDRGRATRRVRTITAITSDEQVEEDAGVYQAWDPWREDRPTIRARVISASGQVTELDPAKVTEQADRLGEGRHVAADLVLGIGAVVEQEVTIVDREPTLGGRAVMLGLNSDAATTHVTITVPSALKAKVVARALPKTAKSHHASSGGRETWTFEFAQAPVTLEADVPPGTFQFPEVSVSLAKSWSDVARAYDALIEPTLAVPLPAELHAGDSLANARAVTAWLHQHVTWSKVELPHAPLVAPDQAATLKRGTGSSAELGLLLAGMLRAAGIQAEVVLVHRGLLHDFDAEVPNLGSFDHMLVRAKLGGVDTWIDPEDPDVGVGQLDDDSQGQFALAIGQGALIETPRAPATANVVHQVRTFDIAELGNTSVTEVTTESGVFAINQRHWFRRGTAMSQHNHVVNYVEHTYDGDLESVLPTAVDELDKPFAMTSKISQSRRAYTHWDSVAMYLNARDAFDRAPWELRSDKAKDRTRDLAIATPHIFEIENRLVIPVGFTVPAAQPEKTQALGAARFVESQRVEGRTLIITYRFELAKSRLTAAEANETRKAIVEASRDSPHLVFPHTAWALLDKGKLREGLAEMTALINADPKNAIQHARYAQMLVKAGAGESARREGKKAVELDPHNADAHVAYAYTLEHDLIGRRWAPGFDRAGVVREASEARRLAPKHLGAALELAYALQRGTRGRVNGAGSDLRAAADAYRAAFELDPKPEHAKSLVWCLLSVGDGAGAAAVAKKLPASTERDAMLIAGTAIAEGPDAALRLAPASDRVKAFQTAGSLLMLTRQYDLMRRMFAEAGSIPGSAAFTQEIVTKTHRLDPAKAGADLGDVAFELVAESLEPTSGTALYWDARTAAEIREVNRIPPIPYVDMMPLAVLMDIARSLATASVEGDANAWRVELEVNKRKTVAYVAADHGVPKVLGMPGALRGVGRYLLRLSGKKDDVVIRMLDWVAKDAPYRRDLAYVWGAAQPKDTVHVTLAASVLADEPDSDIAAGTACGVSTQDGQLVCDDLVARGYRIRGQWAELESFAASWIARANAQAAPIAAHQRALALAHLGRLDEADKLVDDALAAHPDDIALLVARMNLAALRHQPDEVVKRADAILVAKPGNAVVLNNVAWFKYTAGVDVANALVQARQAVAASKSPFILNTLAALEAETGDLGTALADARKAVEVARREEPSDGDWYVIARVCELAGLRDDAIAAYRRVSKPKTPNLVPDTYELAAARLAALGATKK
jgi:tetratricopeptide (TPR) repeat protein